MRIERALLDVEARAARTEALLAAIVSCSDDAVISKSLDGRITSWNEGASRLFGYSLEEALGQPVLMIVPPELHEEESRILARLARGERIDHFETVRVAKDGRRIDVSLAISPIRDDDGTVIGASNVSRDISERKRMEEQLRVADRRKDEFIAILGHELRNPLAPIRTAAEVLRRTAGSNPECVHLCDILERQVQQMTRLLDDLLDVSRITQGKINFRSQAVDIGMIVQRAVEAIRPLVQRRGHRLTVDVLREPCTVVGDFERLVQLVTNLLNNAAKYTPDGGDIQVRILPRDAGVEIHVKDDGIGIAPGVLPHVFDLFVQDQTARETQDGLGIGLSLVRMIARHHGGSVVARSEGVGRGSEFIVTLPATIKPLAGPSDAPASQAATSRKRIVVVDDNRDALDSLAMLLRLSGHDVTTVTDGESAVSVVLSLAPDFAIIDIGLPGVSGYEVALRLRKANCTVPLAALTGYGSGEDRERSQLTGFDHHFVKPVDPAVLGRVLNSLSTAGAKSRA
jgi:PAS domain S-box-containing protein